MTSQHGPTSPTPPERRHTPFTLAPMLVMNVIIALVFSLGLAVSPSGSAKGAISNSAKESSLAPLSELGVSGSLANKVGVLLQKARVLVAPRKGAIKFVEVSLARRVPTRVSVCFIPKAGGCLSATVKKGGGARFTPRKKLVAGASSVRVWVRQGSSSAAKTVVTHEISPRRFTLSVKSGTTASRKPVGTPDTGGGGSGSEDDRTPTETNYTPRTPKGRNGTIPFNTPTEDGQRIMPNAGVPHVSVTWGVEARGDIVNRYEVIDADTGAFVCSAKDKDGDDSFSTSCAKDDETPGIHRYQVRALMDSGKWTKLSPPSEPVWVGDECASVDMENLLEGPVQVPADQTARIPLARLSRTATGQEMGFSLGQTYDIDIPGRGVVPAVGRRHLPQDWDWTYGEFNGTLPYSVRNTVASSITDPNIVLRDDTLYLSVYPMANPEERTDQFWSFVAFAMADNGLACRVYAEHTVTVQRTMP